MYINCQQLPTAPQNRPSSSLVMVSEKSISKPRSQKVDKQMARPRLSCGCLGCHILSNRCFRLSCSHLGRVLDNGHEARFLFGRPVLRLKCPHHQRHKDYYHIRIMSSQRALIPLQIYERESDQCFRCFFNLESLAMQTDLVSAQSVTDLWLDSVATLKGKPVSIQKHERV